MNAEPNNLISITKNRSRKLVCLTIGGLIVACLVLLPSTTSMQTNAAVNFHVGGIRHASHANLAVLTPLPPGSLDATFGMDGKVTTPFSSTDSGYAVAIQADGKIVVAGTASTGESGDFCVVRYKPDGSLDETFNGVGKVITNISESDIANAIAIQPDGKIVVAGYSQSQPGYDLSLVRYNPNGSLDTTFDGDGKVLTNFGFSDLAHGLVIQPDAKIVVAGSTSNSQGTSFRAALARYNTDGSLDASFGTDGKVTTFETVAFAIAMQPDGKLVTAGVGCPTPVCTLSNYDFTFLRYKSDGSPDTSFDTDGKVTVDFGSIYEEGRSIALQNDGKIVATGGPSDGFSDDPFILVRLNPDGSLDTTFDGDGKVITPIITGVQYAQAVAIQQNGKIIVGGTTTTNPDFAVARYESNGSLDSSFGNHGIVTTAFGGGIRGMALQTDGKIVAAGYTANGGDFDLALARYIGDAVMAANANVSGRVTTPDGRGLRNAIVALTDPLGVRRTATTSSFGNFMFDNVVAGETYVIGVSSKRYRFASRNLIVTGSITDVDFVGLE